MQRRIKLGFLFLMLACLVIVPVTDVNAALLEGFIITVDTTVTSVGVTPTGNEFFLIPTYPGLTYNYNVDCNNDGTDEITGATGNVTCDYSATGLNTGPGTYTIRITDNAGDDTGFPAIYFNNEADAQKVTSLDQWGNGKWTTMQSAFYGCVNMSANFIDSPDLSLVSDMSSMFQDAASFNEITTLWDVSTVTNMAHLFDGASSFIGDIEDWDVSSVTDMNSMLAGASNFSPGFLYWNVSQVMDMSSMFAGASSFNADISGWEVTSLVDMSYMFDGASVFNANIGSWNTSNVTNMAGLFRDAAAFDQSLSTWDTTLVTNMQAMFSGAANFNQDIGDWETGNVTDMSMMFNGAVKFNQDINSWNTSKVTTFAQMFAGADAFNQSLNWWETGSATNMSQMFQSADAFNQNLSDWDTSKVTNMTSMFDSAVSFNQNLGEWDVTSLTDATDMFAGVTLSTGYYDALLNGWDAQVVQGSVPFSAGNSQYCLGKTAHDDLVNNQLWTITDGGEDPSCGDFVITVSGTAFEIQRAPDTSYNYNVDCDGDGVDEYTGLTTAVTCSYGDEGPHTIAIADNSTNDTGFPHFYMYGSLYANSLLSVEQWGTIQWASMESAFEGCSNLVINDPYGPDLSHVTSLARMFRAATNFNSDISSWDISNVTDLSYLFFNAGIYNQGLSSWNTANVTIMYSMFYGAESFNQDIGDWDTANVTQMGDMFYGARAFNQDIGRWDTSKVESMISMFKNTDAFNQNIGGWNTANVNQMSSMFWNADVFNQDISGWNTSKVTGMSFMFAEAAAFNQDISGWDTSKVESMYSMFFAASAFDQGLSGWNVESVTKAYAMFSFSNLSTANYDALLNGWATQTLHSGVVLGAMDIPYCRAEYDRYKMQTQGWAFLDGGRDCTGEDPFWSSEFGYGAGWENPETPRTVADVDGDGINDLIGFSPDGVRIGLGTGIGFAPSTLWLSAYGSSPEAGGWGGANTIRTVADVNGDGRADIVGFGNYGVVVSLSTAVSFAGPEYWIYGFGSDPFAGGWSSTDNNRVLADVNGDGMADVVGFADYGVLVSLSTGTSFATEQYWIYGYGRILGDWDGIQNPRMIADINGDGCGDVVGFGNYGIVASLSNACNDTPVYNFGAPSYWAFGYAYLLGDWDSTHHIRTFSDVDGDGSADMVGFGDYGVLVSLSDGTSTFETAEYWIMGYGYVTGGWDVDLHPRSVADVNGDGKGDVVGYATSGVIVSLSDGTQFE